MKHTLLFLLLIFSGMAGAQTITIPDANFKNLLLNSSTNNGVAKDSAGNMIIVDINNDDEIQQDEALLVYSLDVAGFEIASLEGIEHFTNLTHLNCAINEITELDVSNLDQLIDLTCAENPLSSLIIGELNQLLYLYCNDNSLSTLDLSGAENLLIVNCMNGLVTDLNLSGLVNLNELNCENNLLTELDVTSLVNLISLNCSNNNISGELNLSNTKVVSLSFENNDIDFVNIKNGMVSNGAFEFYEWGGNPLIYICADENELDFIDDYLNYNNYTNVNVNTYCSFTPGGDYNTITGILTFDANGDGCNAGDVMQSFIKVNVNDGTETTSTFTSASGEYTFYTQNGEFTITPEFENDYFTVSPAAVVNFPVVDNSVATENFCISANGVHNDVEVVMVPVIPARPGENAVYLIVYKNKGNQVLSGSVNCLWDYTKFGNVSLSPSPNLQANGDYTWFYSNLQPFENRAIVMTLEVNAPNNSTPVDIGDILDFTATATPLGSDAMPQDNEFVLNQEVVDSFNANNIICIEGESAAPEMIGEYLHYVINFSNTGNAPANSIVIVTDINPADFDINTLQMLNSSHEVEVRVNGNTLEFIFEDVNMAAADHGNILFKLKSRTNLMAGDSVMNSASVYFDYNMPVITNNAETVFGSLSTGNFELDTTVKVYPNPSKGIINITADSNVESIELYDIQGRLLQSAIANDVNAKLDISHHTSGIYFVKIQTEKGGMVEKIIKE